jgi:hypothetical protein
MTIFKFGKYQGREVTDVTDKKYLLWFLNTVDTDPLFLAQVRSRIVDLNREEFERQYDSIDDY